MWRKLSADGSVWQVRVVPGDASAEASGAGEGQEMIEFRPEDGLRPTRRLAVDAGALDGMDEEALRTAFRQARPIGGDYYGRPGKRMPDVRES